ncbi:hypothetical protein STAFG_2893 [Streptomyces afghaniensis 772]|uniref:Uncharacterized protein n=1 Tax=Streptomyces afghaniensis 772 TaxID=1283301 RepID=S4MTP8_9ACTN|nr:hypothetical protein STAFG_2893 [Streptomyces afghaniensis 772]
MLSRRAGLEIDPAQVVERAAGTRLLPWLAT